MKPPLFVPETFSVIELIQVFKKENRSFAVELDEQGSTAGIVTLDGWLLEKFDSLPSSGEALRFKENLFIVEDQSQRRITLLF